MQIIKHAGIYQKRTPLTHPTTHLSIEVKADNPEEAQLSLWVGESAKGKWGDVVCELSIEEAKVLSGYLLESVAQLEMALRLKELRGLKESGG